MTVVEQTLTPRARAVNELVQRLAGEPGALREALTSMLEREPDCAHALGHLAWQYGIEGDYRSAIACYERLMVLTPANLEPVWRRGDRWINLGELGRAEDAYRETLERDPECEPARIGLRYIEYLRRKPEEAAPPAPMGMQEPTSLQRDNALLNDKEFEAQKLTLQSRPTRLYLESTLKCNFYCKTCSKGYEVYAAEDLRPEILELVTREVLPYNRVISITGFGEPTMAANFSGILDLAVANGSKVHFVTNASLLNFDRLEKLMRVPVDIVISFDGGTKETFEMVRAGSNFERTLEKLAMIKKLRDIFLADMRAAFSFNFVALRCNIRELPEVVRIARRYDIINVGVADYAFGGTEFDVESNRYDPQAANKAIRNAETLAKEAGINLMVPPDYDPDPPPPPGSSWLDRLRRVRRLLPEKNRFPQKCTSPWNEPYIHVNGVVTPCCASPHYLGDLRTQSFDQVWNGWRYWMLRLRIHSPLPPLGCRTCFVHFGINGGNAGAVMAKEGLLIKALYFLEYRLQEFRARLRGWAGRLRAAMPRNAQRDAEPAVHEHESAPMAAGSNLDAGTVATLLDRAGLEAMPAAEGEARWYYRGRPITARNRP